MLGLDTVTLCMCTLFRTTMTHIRVHSLGYFSSIQWPRSKTSSIHVHIHANDAVCFTCTNWHKKHCNQTNHQYHQHVVAVEKNCTVITCTCTQIPPMSGVSLVTSGRSFMLHQCWILSGEKFPSANHTKVGYFRTMVQHFLACKLVIMSLICMQQAMNSLWCSKNQPNVTRLSPVNLGLPTPSAAWLFHECSLVCLCKQMEKAL